MTGNNFLNLSCKELDSRIYRITKQDYIFSMFQSNENVISQVHSWKDGFENFQMKLGGVLEGEKFNYSFKDDFGGQCWTTEKYSEAMWGIYANDPEQRYLEVVREI